MIRLMTRLISGFNPTNLLIENALIQECNVLYRTFDETEIYEKIASLRYEFERTTGRYDYECPVKAMNKMK
jgi:hypothetical protein